MTDRRERIKEGHGEDRREGGEKERRIDRRLASALGSEISGEPTVERVKEENNPLSFTPA